MRQLRRCPWLSLRARAIVLLYIDLWGWFGCGCTLGYVNPLAPRLIISFGNVTALTHYG